MILLTFFLDLPHYFEFQSFLTIFSPVDLLCTIWLAFITSGTYFMPGIGNGMGSSSEADYILMFLDSIKGPLLGELSLPCRNFCHLVRVQGSAYLPKRHFVEVQDRMYPSPVWKTVEPPLCAQLPGSNCYLVKSEVKTHHLLDESVLELFSSCCCFWTNKISTSFSYHCSFCWQDKENFYFCSREGEQQQ